MSERIYADGVVVAVEPGRLEFALSRFKKKYAPIAAEMKRRSYYLGPSARRRQKRSGRPPAYGSNFAGGSRALPSWVRAMTPNEVHERVRRAIAREADQHAAHLAQLRRVRPAPGRLDDTFDVPMASAQWPVPNETGRVRAVEGRRRLIEKTAALRLGAVAQPGADNLQ